jgi:hypothetical protein
MKTPAVVILGGPCVNIMGKHPEVGAHHWNYRDWRRETNIIIVTADEGIVTGPRRL